MKKNCFLAKTLGMIVFATVFVSCTEEYSINEMTEDKVINLHCKKAYSITEEVNISYLENAEICYSGISMSLTLEMEGYFKRKINFPSGGSWIIYPDSTVIITANQHKLKINYWTEDGTK